MKIGKRPDKDFTCKRKDTTVISKRMIHIENIFSDSDLFPLVKSDKEKNASNPIQVIKRYSMAGKDNYERNAVQVVNKRLNAIKR